jgi:hypothetical protein
MLFYSNVNAQTAEPIVTKELHTNIGALEDPEQLLTHLGAFLLTFYTPTHYFRNKALLRVFCAQ